jgi:hypothetical protein
VSSLFVYDAKLLKKKEDEKVSEEKVVARITKKH